MNLKKYLPYILLVIALALLWRTCNKAKTDTTVAATNVATPAQKLASADIGSSSIPFDINDPEVKKIDELLSRLATSYNETPNIIGNATYTAFMRLKRNGHNVSNLSLLQHMVGVIPVPGVRYKLAVMQYASELEKQ